MNNYEAASLATIPTKLTGRISSYNCVRESASFVLSPTDQKTMGAIAVAASLAGLSGSAIAVASNAASVEEEADYVQFQLDDHSLKGWVWRSPFENGDEVEVVAEWADDHYELFGIFRPRDGIISLYPHCSRGRWRHIRNALVLWLWLGVFGMNILLALLTYIVADAEGLTETSFFLSCAALSTFFAAMFASLAHKWMPFVRLAEKIFATLGWANARNIDLVRSSKAKRLTTDTGEFGTFYFRR